MIFKENEQPLVVTSINFEKSTIGNIDFNIEEFEEGIVSYRTLKKVEELLKTLKNNITEERFTDMKKQNKPLFYIIYDIEKLEIYIRGEEFIRECEEYNNIEEKILKSLMLDLN